jgi:hypothetical protein
MLSVTNDLQESIGRASLRCLRESSPVGGGCLRAAVCRPRITAADQSIQAGLFCSYAQNAYTNAVLDQDAYRTPLPAESKSYELIQFTTDANQPGVTNLFRFAELQAKIAAANDGSYDIAFGVEFLAQMLPTDKASTVNLNDKADLSGNADALRRTSPWATCWWAA